jgi:N12 class adenine-specific DNA methylase
MALGTHARTTSAFGPTYTCLPTHADEHALSDRLIEALYSVPTEIYTPQAPVEQTPNDLFDETIQVGTAAEGATIKEGSFLIIKDNRAEPTRASFPPVTRGKRGPPPQDAL